MRITRTLVYLATCFLSVQLWAGPYQIIDLGEISIQSFGASVNDSGKATGYSYQGGNQVAFLYQSGSMTAVGPAGIGSAGTGINAFGTIAGTLYFSDGSFHGFYDQNGVVTDIGTLGGTNSNIEGINDSGTAVGWSSAPGTNQQTVVTYANGAFTNTGIVGTGNAINNAGVIVGETNSGHAFKYDGTNYVDLGNLGGLFASANAINSSGQIAGSSRVDPQSSQTDAFLDTNGVMHDIGSLGGTFSFGEGINDAGEVVGYSTTASSNFSHAFLYDGTHIIDLNNFVAGSPFASLTYAFDINNQGEIIGTGTTTSGRNDAFLMIPTESSSSGSVPEPATMALFGAGLLGLARKLRGVSITG